MVWWTAVRVRPEEIGRLLTGGPSVGREGGTVQADDEAAGSTGTRDKADTKGPSLE
jgi:hypothetical protein